MWLSLVERCVRDAEAAGSNPVIPTIECETVVSSGAAVFLFSRSAQQTIGCPAAYRTKRVPLVYQFRCCHSWVWNSNMSRALSRDKFGQTPCFSGPGLIIWPASLPRWTCLDRRASSQSNIRGFAGRAAAASDRRGSPPRALYVAGVASQFVATAGGVTFGLKSLPAGVPREQRPRE